MIQRAIRELNEEDGSTEEAISKFIREKYTDLPLAHVTMLKHHLKKHCEAGDILVTGYQRYMLYGNLSHIPSPSPSPSPSPGYSPSLSPGYSPSPSPSPSPTPSSSSSSSISLNLSSSSSSSPKRKQTKRKTRRKRSRRRGRPLKKSEADYGVGEERSEQLNEEQDELEEQHDAIVGQNQSQEQEIEVPIQPVKQQNDERILSEAQEQDDIDQEKPPGFEHVAITEEFDNQFHGGAQLPAGRGMRCGRSRGRPPKMTPEDAVATEHRGRGRPPSRYRGWGRQRKLDFRV